MCIEMHKWLSINAKKIWQMKRPTITIKETKKSKKEATNDKQKNQKFDQHLQLPWWTQNSLKHLLLTANQNNLELSEPRKENPKLG